MNINSVFKLAAVSLTQMLGQSVLAQLAPAQPAPTQSAPNPLDQLKDIHLPDNINQFELAPGWWFLITLLALSLIYLGYRLFKKRHALRLLKPAKQELTQIAALTANNHSVAQLSALIKRVCLIYFPNDQVASLSGDNWTSFLNQQSEQPFFTDEQKAQLTQLAYQANAKLDKQQWQQLIKSSEQAIEYIIRQQALQADKAKGN
jgi:hypothetical protein